MYIPKVAAMRCHVRELALLGEELNEGKLSLGRHRIVAGIRLLKSKTTKPSFWRLEACFSSSFSAILISYSTFSLLRVSPAAISDRDSLSALSRDYRLSELSDKGETPFHVVQSLAL